MGLRCNTPLLQYSTTPLLLQFLMAQKAKKGSRTARPTRGRRWSGAVTARSNALDLDPSVFTWKDPRRIAASLKRSADRSTRRKGTPYQSAMSMLNFYINRAGKNLDATQRRVLARTKGELRKQFGRSGGKTG